MTNFRIAAIAAIALSAVPASAVTTIFLGQDDGVAPGSAYVNSAAAEAAFKSAAATYGGVTTETFESATVGFYSPLDLADIVIGYSTQNFGPSLSGVNNTQIGTAVYAFNVTDGGTQWLGFPDFFNSAATMTFKAPTNSIGFYITGVQDIFTSSLTLELLDGSMQTFALPINTDGGVAYFGLVDSLGFTAVHLSQANYPGYADAWGIDDISYNVVPEAATWAMMIVGFGLVGAAARRRRPLARMAA